MDEILAGIPHLFIYLDDVLVASLTVAEHKADLQRVMERLRQHRLFISKEVPALQTPGGVPESPGGPERFWLLPVNVEAITKYPRLSTCSQLLSFLG